MIWISKNLNWKLSKDENYTCLVHEPIVKKTKKNQTVTGVCLKIRGLLQRK